MTVIVGDNTAETLTGSSGADSITANGGADTILADDGADTIRGGDGVDSIDSGLGDDRIYESTFFDSDTIFGGVILGGDGNDTITAGHITASLSIDGGSGNDTLHIFDTSSNLASVTGIETIIYESFSYQTITLADGNVGAGQTLTVMAGDLNNLNAGLTLNGSAELDGFLHISTLDHEISTLFGTADSIVGGAQADVINTFLGDDTIKGGLGDDTINGGTGTDTVVYSGNSADYIVTTSGLAVIVGGPDGVDTLYNVNRLKFADGVVVAVVPGQSLVGDGLSNTLNGGEGADTILGLGAADVLNGGDANDSIDAGAGEDSAVGGSGADTILGGEGNDTLRGGNGVDSVDGGTGNDLIYESDFFDSDNVFGGVIQGGAGDDTIWAGHIVPQGLGWLSVDGGLGNDVLHIVDSASNLTHVTGIETIVYESFSFQSITLTDINVGAAQTLTIVAGQLNNLNAGVTINGSAELDGFLNISTLDHSISGLFGTADTVTGGAQSDLIRTYLGADVLNGGGGDDILEGGADNDTLNGDGGADTADYTGSAAKVSVKLALSGAGQNTLGAGVDTLNSIENLTGSAFKDKLRGDNGANVLVGGVGKDQLNGNAGADSLEGGLGADNLFGENHKDTLDGGSNDDTLAGGLGADRLIGGGGADVFVFHSINESGPAAPDEIADLSASDVIDLSGIDADTGQGGDQVFTLVAAFTNQAAQMILVYDPIGGVTRLSMDVNGDGIADAVIVLDGNHSAYANFAS